MRARAWMLAGAIAGLGACGGAGEDPKTAYEGSCRKGPGDDVKMGARTAGEAAKTGGTVAVEGVSTLGKSVGGWFEGGSSEAKKEWNEGKEATRSAAREGADEVDAEASVPDCD